MEQLLEDKGKMDVLADVRKSAEIDIHFIRQKEPIGLGHVVWCARKFIGDEPFAVLLGDDIVQAETPSLKQLMNVFDKKQTSVIGVQQVEDHQTHRYGIIDPLSQVVVYTEFNSLLKNQRLELHHPIWQSWEDTF